MGQHSLVPDLKLIENEWRSQRSGYWQKGPLKTSSAKMNAEIQVEGMIALMPVKTHLLTIAKCINNI